jgi:lipocalin
MKNKKTREVEFINPNVYKVINIDKEYIPTKIDSQMTGLSI